MDNLTWQMIAVLICVAAALWTVVKRFRALIHGQSGCGDCSGARPDTNSADSQDVIAEDQIQMLYESKDRYRRS